VDRSSIGVFVVYLALFLLGVLAEFFFSVGFGIHASLLNGIGLLLVIAGPALILWSLLSIRKFHDKVSGKAEVDFAIGPYRYMRNPTFLGLTFLVAGFGFFADASYVVFSSILSYLIVRSTFLRKEERLLTERYGEDYIRYMKKVGRWF
jgi:protein-S-isoprenylcysteine O-methyltransferase Ste14